MSIFKYIFQVSKLDNSRKSMFSANTITLQYQKEIWVSRTVVHIYCIVDPVNRYPANTESD